MCDMEMGNFAEWVAAAAAVATAVIAAVALSTWRDQMRGTSRHAAAAEIAEAAQLLKYHFYEARSAWVDAGEFPAGYSTGGTPTQEAEAWAYVLQNRYDLLKPQILRLATLRAKAGALLSEETAEALGALARKASELHNFFRHRIEQIRVGPNIVSMWDQQWVQKVNYSWQLGLQGQTDPYSLEFDQKFEALMKLVRQFM